MEEQKFNLCITAEAGRVCLMFSGGGNLVTFYLDPGEAIGIADRLLAVIPDADEQAAELAAMFRDRIGPCGEIRQ